MYRVGYEKLTKRHYRQHLVEPSTGQALCGFSGERLAHLASILEPGSFLAVGSDAEVCRKCVAKASAASAGRGEVLPGDQGDDWAEIVRRMTAEGRHLFEEA
jgi:hypothetical protein